MKLLWLSISEAHTQASQAYKDEQYEIMQGTNASNKIWMNVWCYAQIKERVRETMDQTQTQRYVSRFEPLALRPRLHHRVGFLIHYTPIEGTSTEEDLYNKGVPNSSLKHRLITEG